MGGNRSSQGNIRILLVLPEGRQVWRILWRSLKNQNMFTHLNLIEGLFVTPTLAVDIG